MYPSNMVGSPSSLLPLLLLVIPARTLDTAGQGEKGLWHTMWTLPAEDQRALGVCLHMYLERDYPEIERIVFPADSRSSGASQGERQRVLVDGPSLEANCLHLKRMVHCFARSLSRMHYYENFREFRRLVTALDAVLLELCGTVDLMRHRFLPLLQSLDCMERVRASTPCGVRLPSNLWHQLVRLEIDSTLCWPLARQLRCVRDSYEVRYRCGETAHQLFANLSGVFMAHWCFGSATTHHGAPSAPALLAITLALLCSAGQVSICTGKERQRKI